MSQKQQRVLSLIPPMTQLNTPYPSTAYLTGFLRSRGIEAVQADLALARDAAIAAAFAFVAALLALGVMMRLLPSVSFTPYVIYRVVLGVVLLWIAYA